MKSRMVWVAGVAGLVAGVAAAQDPAAAATAAIPKAELSGAAAAVPTVKASKWETSVAFGANLTDGNSKTMGANASATTARSWEKHDVRLGVEGNYGKSTINKGTPTEADETTTQNGKAALNYKRKFDWLYGYSDDSLFHDRVADLNYRAIVGAGAGVFVLAGEQAKLGVEAGGAYVKEEYAGGNSDDYFACRFAARHDQVLSKTSKAWAAIEYLPSIKDWTKAYLLNGEAGIEAALWNQLSMRVVIQDRYNSIPTGDRENNDLAAIAALAYKL